MDSTPSTMRAVLLRDYDGKPESITITTAPVPQPGPGQVLVEIAAAPVNPSDLMFVRGLYGFRRPLPTIPGLEGSGRVVAAGSGAMARLLLGRRVACAAADPDLGGGTWAQYVVTNAKLCVPLRKSVDNEQGASMLVNPFTAWGLMERARRENVQAVVQTAAASALGRMIVRLGRRFGIGTINVVHRPEQVDLLRRMGAEHVLDSGEAGFDEHLRDLCHALGATMAFEAVAGETTGRVLRAQPAGSRVLVYGALSREPMRIDPAQLIFEDKRIEGFWLTSWLRSKSPLGQLLMAGKVQRLLATDLRTDIQARLPLEEAARGLEQYASHMTRGKVLFMPNA